MTPVNSTIITLREKIISGSFLSILNNSFEWNKGSVIVSSAPVEANNEKTIVITTPYASVMSWLFQQLEETMYALQNRQKEDFYKKFAIFIKRYLGEVDTNDIHLCDFLLNLTKKAEDILDEFYVEVFVYGTLMSGESNHSIMRNAEFLGEDIVEGAQLFHLGTHPMLVRGEGIVGGECYRISLKTLETLDRLEGHPEYYHRKQTCLKSGRQMYVYQGMIEQVRGYPHIFSGQWSEVSRSKTKFSVSSEEDFVSSDTYDLILRLRRLNVKIHAENGNLRCEGPHGALSATLRAEISQQKKELLMLLRRNNSIRGV